MPASEVVKVTPTPQQLAQERSLLFALFLDTAVLALFIPVAFMGGSLTIKAETIRFVLMMSIEVFALIVMWRLHRGKLTDMEFGGGKLEQIASLVTGIGLLGGAAWVATKAMAIVSGEAAVGTPLGLALAAMVGALNAYVNFIAWDGMRRAVAGGGGTLVMQAQLQARWVKLVCSAVVLVTMTVAALSADNVVVASADALGSIFVAGFMVVNGMQMLRICVPDLLDRSAGKSVRDTVDRVLADSAGNYQRLDRVRSRKSGRVVFIEVALAFEPGLTVGEVNRRIEALKAAMAKDIEHADISILTTGVTPA
jgi:divalent metal cation (Fe/Co/Zn/Cd) transporter